MEVRDKMAYAEYLASMTFPNASLRYVHAMAHQLGWFYDLPHSVCNATLLPHIFEFNKKISLPKFAELAKKLTWQVKITKSYLQTLSEKVLKDDCD